MAGEANHQNNTEAAAPTDTPVTSPKVDTPSTEDSKKGDDDSDDPEQGGKSKDVPVEASKKDTSTEEAKKEDTPKAEGEETPEEGAPESYADFTYPEGTEPDKVMIEKFVTLAKELNIPQEKAQALVDLSIASAADNAKKQSDEWMSVRENWTKEIKEDKEFGGQNFDNTLEHAKRTLRNYGSDVLQKFIEDTGYGDNPDFIRMLAKIDKAMGEDKIVEGKEWTPNKAPHEILYGDTKERNEK